MSLYQGRLQGLAYGDQLRKEREAKVAGYEQDFQKGVSEGAANQAKILAGQQAEPVKPVPEALPTKAPEHGDLATWINHVVQGNPLEAEKSYGFLKNGTLNKDGSVTAVSAEGHPVTITADQVKHAQGYKMPKDETDLDKELKQSQIEERAARTAALKDKPLTADQIAKEERAQRKERRALQKSLSDAKKAYFDQQAIATAAMGKKEEVAERAKALELKRMAEEIQSDFDETESEIAPSSKKTALPVQPPVARGSGKMSMGGRTAVLDESGLRRQDSPMSTFSSEADAQSANLPTGTIVVINGRRAIIR